MGFRYTKRRCSGNVCLVTSGRSTWNRTVNGGNVKRETRIIRGSVAEFTVVPKPDQGVPGNGGNHFPAAFCLPD